MAVLECKRNDGHKVDIDPFLREQGTVGVTAEYRHAHRQEATARHRWDALESAARKETNWSVKAQKIQNETDMEG